MNHQLAAWLHNIDPYLVDLGLWEGGPIRWYGLAYIVGFTLGYVLIRRVATVGICSIKPNHVPDLVVAMMIGVVIGGRLGYVFFYQPALIWTFYMHLPFWGVLAINEGGMASHGGIIGGIVACLWFARRHGHSQLFLLDLLAFGTPLGLFFGRLANFINGELYGRGPTRVPWSVKFPQEITVWPAVKIDQLFQALPDTSSLPGNTLWSPATVIELIQQGHPRVIEVIEPMLTPRHPSQIYAGVLEGLVVFAVLSLAWSRPRQPGIIGSLFCFTYGCMRLFGELFRQPDEGIGFQLWGLTRGQWLSVPLLLSGVAVLFCACHTPTIPTGSWRRGTWTKKEIPEDKI